MSVTLHRIQRLGLASLVILAASGRTAGGEFANPAAAKTCLQGFLGQEGPTAARIQALVAQLGHEEFAVREKATAALRDLGEAATPFLQDAAKSDDPEVRLRAQSLLDAPRKAEQDASTDVGKAVDVLAAAKDKSLVPTLLRLLDSPRVDVRYAAEYGLRRVARQPFAFNATGDEKQRAAEAARCREWWKAAEASFAFDAKPAPEPMPAGVLLSSRRLGQVWAVSLEGKLLWKKAFEGELSRAKLLPNGHLLLSHRGRAVIEEYDADGKVVWSAGEGKLGGDVLDLDRLPNGNTLVAHSSGNRVLELDPQGRTVWSVSVAQMPISATRLPNGNTLVAILYGKPGEDDFSNGRVEELTRTGQAAWSREGLSMPTDAQPLPDGRVLIAEQGANHVIEVNRDGEVAWEYRCGAAPNSARRLPDGTTVVNDTAQGLLLVDKEGKVLRKLDATERAGKLSLLPAGCPIPKQEAGEVKPPMNTDEHR